MNLFDAFQYALVALFFLGILSIELYGAFLCLRKKWYLGLVALCFPSFALIIGGAKIFFKVELLK